MRKKYYVTLTTAMGYTVEAEDVDHAKDLAREQLADDFNNSPDWLHDQASWEVLTVEEE